MLFVRERLTKWIEAAIIITVGILCIVAGAAMGGNDYDAASDALNAISTVLGVVLVIVGSLSLVLAIVLGIMTKKGFAALGLPGAILLAIGISLLASPYAYSFIGIMIHVIPYLLIVIGALFLADAIFTMVKGAMAKCLKGVLLPVIVMIIMAIAAIVLGALCVGENPVIPQNVQLIVFGIVVILVGVAMVLLTFFKLPQAVIAIVATEKEEEKAE